MPRTQLSKVQALVRGRKVRRDALRLAAATTKIQALIRGRKFRRPRTAAATKLQTRARSQQARRTVSDLRTKRIVARSAYKSYLNAWSLDNTQGIPGWAGLELLYHFLPTLKQLFAKHKGLKIHLSALNEFQQSIDGNTFYSTDWATTPIQTILLSEELFLTLKDTAEVLREVITNRELTGSGWKFNRVITLELHVARYKPLGGAALVWRLQELTPTLWGRTALNNLKFPDYGHSVGSREALASMDHCFQFAVLASLFPPADPKNQETAHQYKERKDELDWSGQEFPVELPAIAKFEERNNVSVNVYGWSEKVQYVPRDEEHFEVWWLTLLGDHPTLKEADGLRRYRREGFDVDTVKDDDKQGEDKAYAYPLRISKLNSAESLDFPQGRPRNSGETKEQHHARRGDYSGLPAAGKHVDLVLLHDEEYQRSHYVCITQFSRFVTGGSHAGKRTRHYCKSCLAGYDSQEKLLNHLSFGCAAVTKTLPEMPVKGTESGPLKDTMEFHDGTDDEKQIKVPYVIYGDFEALLVPPEKDEREHKEGESYTQTLQQHEPCGFCLYAVSANPEEQMPKPFIYRGPNAVDKLIEKLQYWEVDFGKRIRNIEPMEMTAQDELDFAAATDCSLCGKPLDGRRVRDHDHQTGQYRGAAHNLCNLREGLKNTKNFILPVIFHNLKGYDGHHIIKQVGKHTSRFTAIPQNFEKMISFTVGHLRFLDSAGFLPQASLDSLAANLLQEGQENFVHSTEHCERPQHLELMLQKGVYPYEYMDDPARFEETALPPQEAFYSLLNGEGISDQDYEHGLAVWAAFECECLGDYHDLYVKSDVLLLADIFEAHRTMCMTNYKLDPLHYFTTPGFAWDAMLLMTGAKLELLTDYNKHLMMKEGIRGGISMISHRHAEANNSYMAEYEETEEVSHIIYVDANNLYGVSMTQTLPQGDFQWSEESERRTADAESGIEWSAQRDVELLVERYGNPVVRHNDTDTDTDNDTEGCFVKVDLHYPQHLHDPHNDYPLAPERKLIRDEMLSPYAQELRVKLDIGSDKLPKLVPNLMDKVGYVCDIRALKFYVEHGLEVTAVHSVITFTQSCWMKDYILFNTERRKQAKNEFEKDFFKLMSNACFGKTMENLRTRQDMDFISSNAEWRQHSVKHERTIARKLASPLYKGHLIYNEDLAAVKKMKKQIVFDKPIYAGMCILDLSKLHMYDFHYDVIKPAYGEKARLLFTDTDSLCYEIKCKDFYQDMWDSKELYDLSNFAKDSCFYDDGNKKVLGKFKDECDGKAASEFVGLRPKMYSLQVGEKVKQTAKGIQTGFVKKHITHADYRRCLMSELRTDQQQHATFVKFNSKKHAVTTDQVSKVGLCAFDNKRYLLGDGITSYSYGHHRIAHPAYDPCEPEPEVRPSP